MSNVLVICARRYNGHELWTALGVMKHRGHKLTLASSQNIVADELNLGHQTRLKQTLDDDLWDEKYDGLMIVSGNMADTEAYWDDARVLYLIEEAQKAERAISAICCSVPTIRYAAEGKKVSFFPLVRSRHRLQDAGAILTDVAMTRDGKLVTAEHQMATQVWAEEFCNVLEDQPQQYFFQSSGYTPKGRERKPMPELEELRRKLRNGNSDQSEA